MVYRVTMMDFREPALNRSPATPTGVAGEPTEAEQAVWGNPDRLARIEAILDDPSLAVPLEDLN